jgi:hypothetical protein
LEIFNFEGVNLLHHVVKHLFLLVATSFLDGCSDIALIPFEISAREAHLLIIPE